MKSLIKKLARTLIFVIQKGGVGKTTSVKNIAAALSLLGKKVLVIDWDPQANATNGLFKEEIPEENTIYCLLGLDKRIEIKPWQHYIIPYKQEKVKFDVLPSGNSLAVAEFELPSQPAREYFFKRKILSKIQEEGDYDFILVDCQPSLGLLVTNVLCSSPNNELIACIRPDKDSQGAIKFLFNTIKILAEQLEVRPKSFKILVTQLLETQISDRDNLNQVIKDLPEYLFHTYVRKDTKLSQARDEKKDIFSFDPESRGAMEYMAIAKEIIEQK